ncbi:MAG: hypothetical protein M0Z75_07585 [Nitrospiraceae bacterium]|nr:hypothetical protein [Nitrospiraceae bacterium]
MSMRATQLMSKAAKCTAAIATAYTIATPGADDDTFSVASAASNPLIGVFQSTTVNAGDSVEVMVKGISNVVLGGTVTRGQAITANASGQGVAAAFGNAVIGIALESGVSGDIIGVMLEPNAAYSAMAAQAIVALADAAATLTAAQLENSGLFTITPTAARALTTDTAANLVAAVPGVQVGACFDITIACLAAYAVTLTAGTGVTITGSAVANNASASFRAIFTSVTVGSEAVTIIRK